MIAAAAAVFTLAATVVVVARRGPWPFFYGALLAAYLAAVWLVVATARAIWELP